MITFWHKMGFCLVQGTIGFILDAANFDAAAEVQTDAAASVISWEFFWIPAIAMAIGCVLLCFYKLDYKTCQEIRENNVAKYGDYVS